MLTSLLKQLPLNEAEQEYEIGRLVMPMSVNRFFAEFISGQASFGFDAFSKDVLLNRDIQYEELKESKDAQKGFPIYQRNMTGIVPISGVPFCSQSHMQKSMHISRPKP